MTGRRQLFTRTRTRLVPDFSRIAKSISRPGIDPRAEVAIARIDEETEDDQDVIRWDNDLGWLVDVTIMQGPYAGQGDINCRILSGAQGNGVTKSKPPRSGTEVVVVFPDGDPNEDAVIIGQLHDINNPPPTTINGDVIVERNPSEGEIAAISTHIGAYPEEDLDQEWRNARITTSGKMTLATADADQKYVRGDDQADALDDLADAISDFATAVQTGMATIPYDLSAAIAALNISISTFKQARQTYLSSKIVGD